MIERETIKTDVLIIGGGPAGLASAIHLADLAKANGAALNILLIEKGSAFGNHSLSGAVINPVALRELLPGTPDTEFPFESAVKKDQILFLTRNHAIPAPLTPPYMSNHGNYVVSLGKLTRYLSEVAEKKGVQIFAGFSGHELLMEGNRVIGVRTGDSGLDKHGKPAANYQPGTDIHAKVTLLAEGTRGHLTKGLIKKLDLSKDRNSQVYSLGIKELWEVPEGTFPAGQILHTMGYPLNFAQFGGGFVYGLAGNCVAVGLVIGLDYRNPTFDPHSAFQIYKKHPRISKILEKGRMIRYGAKTIPEGGYYSLPKTYGDGFLILGDSAGFLSMPSLKGVHLAIQSGMMAAKTALEAVKSGDVSLNKLAHYEELFKKSSVRKDLYRVRNFRQGFKYNLFFGAFNFATQLVTLGRGLTPSGRLKIEEDGEVTHSIHRYNLRNRTFQDKFKKDLVFDKKLTFDKVTDVFYSGTQHDEHAPCHLVVPNRQLCHNVCIPNFGGPCQWFCPAEVYEIATDPKTGDQDLKIHPTNCVHCKTCDIKDPFKNIEWVTPYGGDGPEYETM